MNPSQSISYLSFDIKLLIIAVASRCTQSVICSEYIIYILAGIFMLQVYIMHGRWVRCRRYLHLSPAHTSPR